MSLPIFPASSRCSPNGGEVEENSTKKLQSSKLWRKISFFHLRFWDCQPQFSLPRVGARATKVMTTWYADPELRSAILFQTEEKVTFFDFYVLWGCQPQHSFPRGWRTDHLSGDRMICQSSGLECMSWRKDFKVWNFIEKFIFSIFMFFAVVSLSTPFQKLAYKALHTWPCDMLILWLWDRNIRIFLISLKV